MKYTFSRLTILGLMSLTAASQAVDMNWINAVGNNWNIGASWNPAGPPIGHDVYIDYAPYSLTGAVNSFTTVISNNYTVNKLFTRARLQINSGNLTFNAPGSVIWGELVFNGGDIYGQPFNMWGNFNLTGGGSRGLHTAMTMTGTGLFNAGTLFMVNGTINLSGTLSLGDADFRDGVINVLAGGKIQKTQGAGSATISTSWNGGPRQLNNAGTVTSSSGNITISADGTQSGTFSGTAGGTVTFAGGSHTLNTGTTFNSGVVIQGGSYTLAGTVNTVGAPEFRGGTMFGSGTLAGNKLVLNGSPVINSANVNATGTIEQIAGSLFLVNSTINNSGTFKMAGDFDTRDGVINNSGTFAKTAGAGTGIVGMGWNGGTLQFNNSGLTTSSSGTLRVATGGTHSGTFAATGTGIVQLKSGTHTFNSGAIVGKGFRLDGATMTVVDSLFAQDDPTLLSGTMNGTGSLEAGTITVAGSVGIQGTLTNNSTFDVQQGADIYAVNGTFTNNSTLLLNNSAALTWRDGIIVNNGQITQAGVGTTNMPIGWNGGPRSFSNNGVVTATDGQLNIRTQSSTHTGVFSASGAGHVDLVEGVHTFDGATMDQGSRISGATVDVSTTANFNGSEFVNGTLRGAGTIQGSNLRFVGGGGRNLQGTLTNAGKISIEAADISAVNSTLTNNGTIDINGTGIWRDGIVKNVGLIKKTNDAGTFQMNYSWNGGPRGLDNTGTVRAEAGILQLRGPGTHTGTFESLGSGEVQFPESVHNFNNGAKLKGGAVINGATAVFSGSVDMTGGPEWRTGLIKGNGTLVNGPFFWTGTIGRTIQETLTFAGNVTITGGDYTAVNSTVKVTGVMDFQGDFVYRDGVILNQGTVKKTAGAGTSELNISWNGGNRAFINEGLLEGSSGTILLRAGFSSYDSTTRSITGGTIAVNNGATIQYANGHLSLFDNRSRIILRGPASAFLASNGGAALDTLKLNHGGLEVRDGRSLPVANTCDNSGDTTVDTVSTLSVGGAGVFTNSAGKTRIDGTMNASTVNVTGGILSGQGTINAIVDNSAGIVHPGSPAATLTTGAYSQGNNGTLEITIGNGPFGKLAAASLNLAGRLSVEVAPLTTIPANTTFRIATGARTGTFVAVPPASDWSVVYGANFVDITSQKVLVGPNGISGRITLANFLGNYVGKPIKFEIYKNNVKVEEREAVMEPNGDYFIATAQTGAIDVYAKGRHWLRKKVSVPNVTGGVTGLNITLTNGDVDNSNYVGTDDYLRLNAAFDTHFGDADFDIDADLDGDFQVTSDDYLILNASFDTIGD